MTKTPPDKKNTIKPVRHKKSENDRLTGLLSRSQFEKNLRVLSDSLTDNDSEYALCQIDIDSFKVINDVYGHESGDDLLCSITSIIQKHLNKDDLLARIGDDEFGLILNHNQQSNAVEVANEIRKSIKDYKVAVDAAVYSVTVSIGVLLFDKQRSDVSANIKNVDIACHTAKQSGDKVQVFHDENQQITTYHQDMCLIKQINHALDNDGFALYAQKILPLTASEIINQPIMFEILLRMLDDEGSVIYPGDFLPVAVRHNMSARIDLLVLEKIIGFLQSNVAFANKCAIITINLSAQSLTDEVVLDYLNTHLTKATFRTEILCFEITESEAINNLKAATHFIDIIHARFGCQFAIDDFGAGFSSFKYIKDLPVDIIKIDGSFVKDIHNDPISEIMIRALNDIAQVTHKKTVAEWVETKDVLDTLQDMGVDYGQGYFLGYPMPLEEFMGSIYLPK